MSEPEFDFSHLSAADQTLEPRWCTLIGVRNVRLQMLPATEANPKYWRAKLRMARRSMLLSENQQAEAIVRDREIDRELYPKHVIVGWDVTDAKGAKPAFSREGVVALLEALPDWIFQQAQAFAGNPGNFSGDSPVEVEEAGGN